MDWKYKLNWRGKEFVQKNFDGETFQNAASQKSKKMMGR